MAHPKNQDRIRAVREKGREVREEPWAKRLSIEVTEADAGDENSFTCDISFKALPREPP